MVYSRTMKPRFRCRFRCLLAVVALSLALPAAGARANSEPPSVHGARYTATGGLGAAFVEGPPSVFHNPAGLLSIDKFELTLGFTTLLVTYNAPFGGYGSEQDSPPLIGPLPFLGAGFRVADDWVLGLSLYISVGFGGNFDNIGLLTEGARVTRDPDGNVLSVDGSVDPFVPDMPVDQSVQLFIAELAIPVAWDGQCEPFAGQDTCLLPTPFAAPVVIDLKFGAPVPVIITVGWPGPIANAPSVV